LYDYIIPKRGGSGYPTHKSVVVTHSLGSSKDAKNHEIYNLKLKYLLLPKQY